MFDIKEINELTEASCKEIMSFHKDIKITVGPIILMSAIGHICCSLKANTDKQSPAAISFVKAAISAFKECPSAHRLMELALYEAIKYQKNGN